MEISKIWKEFVETVVDSGLDAYDQVRNVCKTTFSMFKDTLVVAVTGIAKWLLALVGGIANIMFDLIRVVGSALMVAIKSTIGVLLDWIINWIKHL